MNTLEPTGLEAAIDAYIACRPKSTTACQDFGMQQRERISQQVTSAIRAYLSALDVPAHPEGVAWRIVGFEDELRIDCKTVHITVAGDGCGYAILQGNEWLSGKYDLTLDPVKAAQEINAALSHPEPVAQEAVAYASAGQIGSLEDRSGDEGGVYIPLRKTPVGNFQTPLYLHPSPSPEQGEDDLVERLRWRAANAAVAFYTRVSEFQALDIEAATTLSALRARVAELEARATPQAGASEAGAVAQWQVWVDGPDDFGQSGWVNEDAGMVDHWRSKGRKVRPLYATPPDSDAVRALTELANRIDADGTASQIGSAEEIREIAATLSNQGSSS